MKKLAAILKFVAPALIMLLIFYLSSEGHDASSGRSSPIAEFLHLPEWLIRKSAHALIFGLLGVSWYNAFRTNPKLTIPSKILLATLLAGLYAASDEYHQSFNPERSGQLSDVLLDTVAALAFTALFAYIIKSFTDKSKESKKHHAEKINSKTRTPRES